MSVDPWASGIARTDTPAAVDERGYPLAPNAFYVLADWDRDGDWSEAWTNVKDDVLCPPGVVAIYGRDQLRSLSPPAVPKATATLDNERGTYSNIYPGSPLYRRVKRGVPFVVEADYGLDVPFSDPSVPFNSTDILMGGRFRKRFFAGTIDDIPESGSMGSFVAEVTALGNSRALNVEIETTQLYENIRTDVAAGIVLDLAGWPAGSLFRVISEGSTILRYWWVKGKTAIQALIELMLAEGADASIYEDAQGRFHFEGRFFRLNNARSLTSQMTFFDSSLASNPGFNATDVGFNDAFTLVSGGRTDTLYYVEEPGIRSHPDDVWNDAHATVNSRQLSATWAPVWQLGQTLVLGANATGEFVVRADDPFKNAVCQATTDYQVTIGSLASVVLSSTTGTRSTLTIVAGPSGATITGLQVRAQTLVKIGSEELRCTLSPSLLAKSRNEYQYRDFPYALWPEIDRNIAQDLVNAWVLRYMEIQPQFAIPIANVDAAHLRAMMDVQISDRITIKNLRRGISTDAWVERIEHRILSPDVIVTIIGCEQVYEQGVAQWDRHAWGPAAANIVAKWGH